MTLVIDRYLDLVEDWDTACCFLHFQDIKESPKNMQKLEIDLFVYGQLPQSASQYDLSCKLEFSDKNNALS